MFIFWNFFNNFLSTIIEYPKEEFFVYADDHEWSYRITKNGGNIFLVLGSELKDIDTSWNILKRNSSFKILANGDNFRVYYSTRNRVFFEKENLINNNLLYILNKNLYVFILSFFADNRKIALVKKAIKDGFENNLGKNL